MSRDIVVLHKKLSAYLPEGERISGLTPLTAGHSNETYIVGALNAILRLPPSTPPLLQAHDILTQARIYREVGLCDGAPPVPGIRHICEDPDVLGDPFFVMDMVRGESLNDYTLPEWFTSLADEKRGEICRHWVEAIGSLARLPPIAALGEPVTPEDELRRWQDICRDNDCPQLVALIDQLLEIPSPRSGPPSPVHGDCKITNMMFRDQRVSAVLDWELGYNGEPLSDLGYLLYGFSSDFHGATRTIAPSGMWTREQVIPAWEQASGRSASGLIWYEAAEIAKLGGIYAKAKQLFNAGDSTDERMLQFITKLDETVETMSAMLPQVKKTCS